MRWLTLLAPPLSASFRCVMPLAPPVARLRTAAVVMGQDDPLTRLTVVQLKELLRARGLPVSGRKAELVARLRNCAQAVADKAVETLRWVGEP